MRFSNYVEKHQRQSLTSVQRAEAALTQHGEDSSPGTISMWYAEVCASGGVWPRLRSEPKQPRMRRSLESKRGEQIGIFAEFHGYVSHLKAM